MTILRLKIRLYVLSLNRDCKDQGYVCIALFFSVVTSHFYIYYCGQRINSFSMYASHFIRDLLDLVDPLDFQYVFHFYWFNQNL